MSYRITSYRITFIFSYVLAMTDLTKQIEELSSEINVQGLKRRRLEDEIKSVEDEQKFVERYNFTLPYQNVQFLCEIDAKSIVKCTFLISVWST